MSKMPLYLGDEGEQAQGLSQMQDQAGYQEDQEGTIVNAHRLIAIIP